MAKKRMFSLQIVDTDAFLEMPVSSQVLYFHLAMRADDEGFVSSPKKIMRMIGSADDDYKVLIAKKFIIQFESGICVIKHWLIHNIIRMDRFNPTTYVNEKNQLIIKENKGYKLINKGLQPNGNQMATKPSPKLSKVKLIKDKLSEDREETPSPTPSQIMKEFFKDPEPTIQLLIENGLPEDITRKEVAKFIDYWTAPTQSGKKQLWQTKQSFELRRRLGTWFRNFDKFNGFKSRNNKQLTEIPEE